MTFKTLIESIVAVLSVYILPVILTLVALAFIWGAARYLILEGSDESRTKGRQLMLWGLFGIVVLVALWGIVNVALSTLNITPGRGT